jgi:hypothetical protein
MQMAGAWPELKPQINTEDDRDGSQWSTSTHTTCTRLYHLNRNRTEKVCISYVPLADLLSSAAFAISNSLFIATWSSNSPSILALEQLGNL